MNEINIFNENKDIDFHKDHIIQLINLSLETAKYNQVKINLIFCDNDKLNSFKKEYFNDDVLTDIVTFPIKNNDDLEAEIYISVEMARINSKEFNVSLDNELSRLIIHGVLHLIGFNDDTEDSKKIMFLKQEEIISNFSETFVMSEAVKELIDIVIKLRSDKGCDWDRKQTSESLTPHLIEEANEVVDAVLEKNSENLKEELGDLLLHVVFQAVIASEKKTFEFEDVVQQINEKLIKRHPHIFDKNYDGENLSNAKNWELIKKSEKIENPFLMVCLNRFQL